MPTKEIPREEWNNFFDVFSRQHKDWLATLEVFSTDVGAQQENQTKTLLRFRSALLPEMVDGVVL